MADHPPSIPESPTDKPGMTSPSRLRAPVALRNVLGHYGVSYSSSFLGFVIVMVAARVLGAQDFAWVAAGIAFGGFLIPLATLGSDLTFVRDALALADRRKVALMAAKTLGMRATIMATLFAVILVCAPIYAGSIENGLAIALVSGWAGLQGLYPAAWFDYLDQTRAQNRIVFMERVGALVLLSTLWLLPDGMTTATAIGFVLAASRLLSIAIQVRVWTAMAGVDHLAVNFVRPAVTVGVNLYVTAASVANALFIYGNQLFLKNDQAELASYGLAFQIMGLIFVFQSQALRVVSRSIAETCQRRQYILRSMFSNALVIGGTSAVLAVAALVLIQYLPGLLADPKYQVMTIVAPALCVWVVVAGAALSVVQHLLALNQESFYFRTSMIAGLVGVALGMAYVPQHGATAVVAILLGVHSVVTLVNMARVIALIQSPRSGA